VTTPDMTGSLMFFTLGIGAIMAIVALLWLLRNPKNRHPLPDDEPIIPRTSGRGPDNEAREGQN
jgi:hypothetical protein